MSPRRSPRATGAPAGQPRRRKGSIWWRSFTRRAERKVEFERGAVDVGEGSDVGERHALVDLVHGEADETKLRERAVVMDEARIGRAAGRAELRCAARDALDGRGEQIAHLAGRHKKGLAADMIVDRVASTERVELLLDPVL